jgi:CubicO group peptidase (beta-lactamase class C family)
MVSRHVAALLLTALAGCAVPTPTVSRDAATAGPRFNPSGPDADEFGAREGYPTGDRTTFFRIPYLVGSHSQLDQLFESRSIRRATTPSPLGRAATEPMIQYTYQGQTFTLDDYLARNPTTGLLIARGDTILAERYQYGRNDRHRFTSFSMAKTVTSMLVGIAIADGKIRSVDDPASTYVPGLAGTEYGKTSIRHLLQMSSGVRFLEEYSGRDDVSKLSAATLAQRGPGGVDAVTPFNERAVPTGTKFSYASVETQVLGLVLRGAVGRSVADFSTRRSGSRWARKRTRRGSSTKRVRKRRTAV